MAKRAAKYVRGNAVDARIDRQDALRGGCPE
jgi:hypothetical protein